MCSLPNAVGLGFKPDHFAEIRALRPSIGFFEVHAENYMGAGGLPHAQLAALRGDYALSIHGVGLSIGGSESLDVQHLGRLKTLCDRYHPESFSEHLAWSSHGGEYLNDLLPLPYNQEILATVCGHVDQVQEAIGRRMLLENPATYVLFDQSVIPETEFLAEISARTGCGLLLDINNVFVSAVNHRTDPLAYLSSFPLHAVGEFHLGGHAEDTLPSGPLLVDAHGTPIADAVWELFAAVLEWTGPLPTLVEWDNDVPSLDVLLQETGRVAATLDQSKGSRLARAF
jgi:uncharacterized protein (UPF0276 family)